MVSLAVFFEKCTSTCQFTSKDAFVFHANIFFFFGDLKVFQIKSCRSSHILFCVEGRLLVRLHEIGGRAGCVALMVTSPVTAGVACSGCSGFGEKSRMKVRERTGPI